MMRKVLAILFSSAVALATTRPAAAETDAAAQARVYLYRPELFADQFLGVGIPDTRALGGKVWYLRLDASSRALLGPDGLARLLVSHHIPGISFRDDPTFTTGDFEQLFRPDVWTAAQSAGAYSLVFLKLGRTLVDDAAMPTLGKRFELQVLELGERVTDGGMRWLQDLRALHVLELTSPKITDAAMPVVGKLSNVQRLGLRGTMVTDAAVKNFSRLPLKHLLLSASMGDGTLQWASSVKSITQLDASLASVSVSGLSALVSLPGLHTLFLGASIKDADASALGSLKGLRRVDLTGAGITDTPVASLASLPNLEEVALTKTRVTDAALPLLARLPKLRYLEISDTDVTIAGLTAAPAFSALQVLSFSSTKRLTRKDLQPLRRWPMLHAVLINGVLIGPDLLQQLRERTRPQSRLWDWLVPEAQAESGQDIEQVLEIASAPKPRQGKTFAGFQGLPRIHEADSSLEDVVAAPSNPKADSFEANENNFLGEITVNAGRAPKIQ